MSDLAAPPPLIVPDIHVQVTVRHLGSHSASGEQLFAYIVRIENRTEDSWQLLSCEWRILDGGGMARRVTGQGVVGQQPVIAPGGVFVYDSFVVLEAPPGQMSGAYTVRDAWGRPGRVHIAPFALVPTARTLN